MWGYKYCSTPAAPTRKSWRAKSHLLLPTSLGSVFGTVPDTAEAEPIHMELEGMSVSEQFCVLWHGWAGMAVPWSRTGRDPW